MNVLRPSHLAANTPVLRAPSDCWQPATSHLEVRHVIRSLKEQRFGKSESELKAEERHRPQPGNRGSTAGGVSQGPERTPLVAQLSSR